ncbi:MAG: HAD-IIA family hydrolase [Lachnospiraceae bacterium]|nr:HAD-IIA family hydrolase [Lachnospiraceae bacterium]
MDIQEKIDQIKLFALDMDGTVYLGTQWIDGARDFLDAVERSGREYVFLTNNSSKDPLSYIDKLAKMGLDVGREKIITSGDATIEVLQREFPGKSVYLLGNDLLKKQFADAGINLVNEELESRYAADGNIESAIKEGVAGMVVVGFDTSLDYLKMCVVCDLVRAGLPYVSTHPDFNCPTETGFIPDAGSIHAFIEASSFRRPDRIIGKPNGDIMEHMLRRTGYERSQAAMVGDRLYTDVAAGVRNGMCGILVLSGEATMADVETSDVKPDMIFDSVADMIPYL